MKLNYVTLFLATSFLFSCKHTNYMTKAYSDIKKNVHEADVTLAKDTVKVVFPNSVLFDFGSATIKQDIYPAFQHFATELNKYRDVEILVCGHTDTVGNADVNLSLSQRRADSAKALLVQNKVDESRFYTWGMGAKHPIASNSTEAGRQQNRRVEFVVLHKK
ncbi:OmpA family protein [Taibaiella soli]|uniref:OmpA-like domain-containing protein n=1 Tax=Taibaiella soli TaxID=1649169 RepID=A0A2W2AVS5_9BACT|nr:OmpA family protein [Taibaiella soli]PZF72074.1 hypothetical protein DN068_14135 [Taibaiella soli]